MFSELWGGWTWMVNTIKMTKESMHLSETRASTDWVGHHCPYNDTGLFGNRISLVMGKKGEFILRVLVPWCSAWLLGLFRQLGHCTWKCRKKCVLSSALSAWISFKSHCHVGFEFLGWWSAKPHKGSVNTVMSYGRCVTAVLWLFSPERSSRLYLQRDGCRRCFPTLPHCM